MIEQQIPMTATGGMLTIQDMEIPLEIGHLDPIEEVTGWQARLNNLGYYTGPIGEADEEQVRLGVEEFQCDNGLSVDGVCGQNTQNKLKEVHGC
jgi:N-acetylmuramoyl-L-alanine amidase